MRYVLAIAFACTIGTPTAFAMPTLKQTYVSRGDATAQQIAKRTVSRANRQRHSTNTNRNSGIHPLVGSGNY